MPAQPQCPNCQSHEVAYAGLQWYPLRVFTAMQCDPAISDSDHPNEGAVRLYTCDECHTTYAEDPPPAAHPNTGSLSLRPSCT